MQLLKDLLLQTTPGAVLIVSLLKATIVLSLAQLIVSAMPRLSAAARHLLLTAGIASFLVIPLVSLAGPKWSLAVAAPPVTAPDTPLQHVSSLPAPGETAPSTPAIATPAAKSAGFDLIAAVKTLTIEQIAAIVWLLVTFFLITRLLRSAHRVRALVRDASEPSERIAGLLRDVTWTLDIAAPIRLLQSDRISVPMVWGLRNGTLLLPDVAEEWSDEEIRATLIHELGHLQRLDYLSLSLINLVSALLWFHPQVWTARQRALTEGERACDDLVLRAGERASEYASHLLQVARLMPRRDPLTALLAMSRPSQLEGRMYAILSPSVNRQAIGGKLLMTSLTFFMAVVLPLSMMQLTMEPAVAAPMQQASVVAATALPAAAAVTVTAGTAVNAEAVEEAKETREAAAEAKAEATEASEAHDSRHHGISVNSRRNAETCSDFNYTFGDYEVARGEENLTYSGQRLTVAAAYNGGVNVRRSRTGDFTLTACKAAGGINVGEASSVLSRIEVENRGGTIRVNGPDDETWSVQLIVGVPDGRAIDVSAHNGPLSVSGVDATVSARVENGPLSLSNSRGEITAKATNGPLSISKMSGNVNADVKNGPLTLKLDEGAWVGGELRVSVQNGPLSLTLPQNYGSSVQVKTKGNGPFACSLPECELADSGDDDDDHARHFRPRDITFGSGPTKVFVTGGNGPVSIKRARS